MNIPVFILLLAAIQILCFYVGARASRGVKTKKDYFLAGRKIPFFPLMMTFLATQLGGGVILGSAEEAYHYGWSVLLYPLGGSLGLAFLGMGIGRRLGAFQVPTIAQIFEVVYRSPQLKRFVSVLSIVSLFMALVAQVIASDKFLLSMGLESRVWFLAFWGIVILYTSLGGLKAVVATDVVQAVFLIGALFLCFGAVFVSGSSSFASGELTQALGSSKLLGWLLMPLLFMLIGQDMGQRCFAADSPKTVAKSTLIAAAINLLIGAIPISLGILARKIQLPIPEGASVLMMVVQKTTTPTIAAFLGCTILVAIISTADSLLNAISSNVAQDFVLSSSQGEKINFVRGVTMLIALAAILCSFYFNNVVDMLLQSYDLAASCLAIPLFGAFFRKRGHFPSAVLSITSGIFGFLLLRLVPMGIPKELGGVVFSLAGFVVGELWMRFQKPQAKLASRSDG